MKRICLLLVLLLSRLPAFSDDAAIPEPTQKTDVAYRLFRTQNIFTFLKLDTRTGLIWQVQWTNKPIAAERFIAALNDRPLADDKKPGRFTLYPTSNIYTFLLLDQDDGRSWQVQWGEKDDRFIIPIPLEGRFPLGQ